LQKKETESKIGQKKVQGNYSKIASTFGFTSREQELVNKYGGISDNDDQFVTNHEVLAMLGMDVNELKTEASLGLKSKKVGNKGNFNPAEDDEKEEEEEMIDFVNLISTNVMEKLGPRYKKIDCEKFLTYNCLPQPQLQSVPEDQLCKIPEFPEFLRDVFKGIERLNPFQTPLA